jgi:glycosyltransferase involved in cell wall biosynthesis
LVEAEAEALDYAGQVLTPHAELAALFPGKTIRLDWRVPAATPCSAAAVHRRRIAFPGPTLARKGAYELREAARALDLEIVCLGSELEGPDFWRGVATRRPDQVAGPKWLETIAAVVQPSLVEERPRHLLTALAAGVPVVATSACGIAEQPGVTIVTADDPAGLIAALRRVLEIDDA